MFLAALTTAVSAQPLPGTAAYDIEGDPAKRIVDGMVRYLQRAGREQAAKRSPNRERLKTILGVVDARVPFASPDIVSTLDEPGEVLDARAFQVLAVRWPVFGGLTAEGLLFQPNGAVKARVVVLPDAGETPESVTVSQQLAAGGVQVISPVIIGTGTQWSGDPKFRMTKQPHREYIYRMSTMVGRHIIGYEVQKALAAVDWFEKQSPHVPVAVWGNGEGATLALYTAAVDPRVRLVASMEEPGSVENMPEQPLYREVFGLLKDFGDRQLAAMVQSVGVVGDPAFFPVPLSARDGLEREHRQFLEMIDLTQKLARQSESVRDALWSKTEKMNVEQWTAAAPAFRTRFWDEIIGRAPASSGPLNVRTRKAYDGEKWTGYDVAYDVYPELIGYGVLLLPKDLKAGERRPVVVTQHGLDGRPQDLFGRPTTERSYEVYRNIGSTLADRGYIVYLPQNPYIGDFRPINRWAHPLGLSMFSLITAQQERLLDWVTTLPFVDAQKIGFYGLSYGGKTALRVPPLLSRYALAICSGDFNEWIYKVTTVDAMYSYMFTVENEVQEFGLANVANHAEMAKMMAPRPFMVERGHRDGVGVDQWVAYEYAKVRRFYDEMGIGDRTEIEFFNGPHRINGVGTLEFLKRFFGR